MPTARQWIAGARPRTLPAAVAPVAVGAGVAVGVGEGSYAGALLALTVALSLQVAVNYANDYSDGVRGTDAQRVGPFRLVGSGAAAPATVRSAAVTAFGVAAVAGVALVWLTGRWALLGVGALAMLAAWYYTGGRRPYGYRGLGEVSVFVFFGLVAVVGTTYALTGTLYAGAVLGGVGCGSLSSAILIANNLRDIPTDRAAGKHTLAVRLGDSATRQLYLAALAFAWLTVVVAALTVTPWALLALGAVPLAGRPVRTLRHGAVGVGLVPVLGGTSRVTLVYGVLLGIGFAGA